MSDGRIPGLFVSGTDTNVGKTYVATAIVRALAAKGQRVGVYKPAASGGERTATGWRYADPESLWEAAGRPLTLNAVCPQCFAAPLAPYLAARAEGREIDEHWLRSGLEPWRSVSDFLVVEGAGGLLSPLGPNDLALDLALDFQLPLVIVAPNRIGVVNQVLQTLCAARHFRASRSAPVAAVVLNDVRDPAVRPDEVDDPSCESNAELLAEWLDETPLVRCAWRGDFLGPPIAWDELARRTGRFAPH